ncbi:MAG: Asp23/Gls24 family envelope stress response protein, partial [Myxococcota bacterium]
EAAVDVEIVVEFGYPIRDVANEIRSRVIQVIEEMVGRTVLEVNVYVVDIHTPTVESRRRRTLE